MEVSISSEKELQIKLLPNSESALITLKEFEFIYKESTKFLVRALKNDEDYQNFMGNELRQ